ncbi:hypothetical protein [Qipengyuania sp. DGS5-3]|uniref:hypothetical protein n=1 Tax=Qipengyuania sp. DGS5-3 TaxID=3349632 RepID=UPI0036D2AE28
MSGAQTPSGIADAIPTLDTEQAAWTHAGARLLAAQGYGVSIADANPNEANWYLGDVMAFRPSLAQRAALGAPAQELMHALSAHEALLSEVEAATGLAAEFSDHGGPPMSWAVAQLSKAEKLLGEVAFLAAPPMTRKPSAPTPFAPTFVAARLSMSDAERLTDGDMVVLEQGPWALMAEPGSFQPTSLALDPLTGRLAPPFADTTPAPPQQEPAPMNSPDDMEPLSVPVALHLPDILVSPVELARLADGGTLELGPIAEGLQVALAVGGRTVGHGEVVRLGDRFAVLMDAPAEATQTAEPIIEEEADAAQDTAPPDSANPNIVTAEELGSH